MVLVVVVQLVVYVYRGIHVPNSTVGKWERMTSTGVTDGRNASTHRKVNTEEVCSLRDGSPANEKKITSGRKVAFEGC